MRPFRAVRTALSPALQLPSPAEPEVSARVQAAAASAAASPVGPASDPQHPASGDGSARDEPAQDWASAPGLERRNLVFAIQDGEVVAVVTDQRGVALRTVPPEELEEVRRAQARAGILVDVTV